LLSEPLSHLLTLLEDLLALLGEPLTHLPDVLQLGVAQGVEDLGVSAQLSTDLRHVMVSPSRLTMNPRPGRVARTARSGVSPVRWPRRRPRRGCRGGCLRRREVIELTANLLSSLVHHANGHALLQELLPEILPWTRFLPAIDRQNLIQEFTEVTGAAASIGNVAPIAQLLIEWRHTAEVHADPELQALLSAPRGEDHGPTYAGTGHPKATDR